MPTYVSLADLSDSEEQAVALAFAKHTLTQLTVSKIDYQTLGKVS